MGSSRFGGETDKADLSPIIGLAAVGRAAIAVEGVGIGVGVKAEYVEPGNTGSGQTPRQVTRKIEVRPALRTLDEMLLVGGIVGQEAPAEALVDLVAGLPDARTNCGTDAIA